MGLGRWGVGAGNRREAKAVRWVLGDFIGVYVCTCVCMDICLCKEAQ